MSRFGPIESKRVHQGLRITFPTLYKVIFPMLIGGGVAEDGNDGVVPNADVVGENGAAVPLRCVDWLARRGAVVASNVENRQDGGRREKLGKLPLVIAIVEKLER